MSGVDSSEGGEKSDKAKEKSEDTEKEEEEEGKKISWDSGMVKLLFAYCSDTGCHRKPGMKPWKGCVSRFQEKGYKNVNTATFYNKYQGLLKTYKKNKDKQGRSGEGAVVWEYFEAMDALNVENHTISNPNMQSSLAGTAETAATTATTTEKKSVPSKKRAPSVGTQILDLLREEKKAKSDNDEQFRQALSTLNENTSSLMKVMTSYLKFKMGQ